MIAAANDDAWQQLSAMFPDAARPDVKQVRVVAVSEWAQVMAECIQSFGFPATVRADGGISYGAIPDEQAEGQNLATYTCRVRYPIDPAQSLPLTKAETAYIYDYYENSLIPCLSSQGHDIEMPSAAVLADKLASQGAPWSPYQELSAVAGDELDRLLIKCPQVPSGFRGAP